jgi:hypothetical protein
MRWPVKKVEVAHELLPVLLASSTDAEPSDNDRLVIQLAEEVNTLFQHLRSGGFSLETPAPTIVET